MCSLISGSHIIFVFVLLRLFRADVKTTAPTGPNGLTLNVSFVTPSETIKKGPVAMITVPATTGVMGIAPEHAPTIAQLKPGVVTVHGNDAADITHK